MAPSVPASSSPSTFIPKFGSKDDLPSKYNISPAPAKPVKPDSSAPAQSAPARRRDWVARSKCAKAPPKPLDPTSLGNFEGRVLVLNAILDEMPSNSEMYGILFRQVFDLQKEIRITTKSKATTTALTDCIASVEELSTRCKRIAYNTLHKLFEKAATSGWKAETNLTEENLQALDHAFDQITIASAHFGSPWFHTFTELRKNEVQNLGTRRDELAQRYQESLAQQANQVIDSSFESAETMLLASLGGSTPPRVETADLISFTDIPLSPGPKAPADDPAALLAPAPAPHLATVAEPAPARSVSMPSTSSAPVEPATVEEPGFWSKVGSFFSSTPNVSRPKEKVPPKYAPILGAQFRAAAQAIEKEVDSHLQKKLTTGESKHIFEKVLKTHLDAEAFGIFRTVITDYETIKSEIAQGTKIAEHRKNVAAQLLKISYGHNLTLAKKV